MSRKRIQPQPPTLENILSLFSKRLKEFSGESRRSYQKAFTSFQLFAVGNYPSYTELTSEVIENWIVAGLVSGYTRNTAAFYLDKIAGLYSAVAHILIGGKASLFKDTKLKLKALPSKDYKSIVERGYDILKLLFERSGRAETISPALSDILNFSFSQRSDYPLAPYLWACGALMAGIPGSRIMGILKTAPQGLELLTLCSGVSISEKEKEEIKVKILSGLQGEEKKWYAMRLRPKVKFETVLDRFSKINSSHKIPELFYPYEEIARKVGRKLVWQGKPVIRDVVFFKTIKSRIYPLFSQIHDLAWCYTAPGGGSGNYASIPSRAMEQFKEALGFLGPDFEVAPAGVTKLKAGDKVVIVNGDYAKERAEILKQGSADEEGNVVFRVKLLDSNGHWDIGIDARLLKKLETV